MSDCIVKQQVVQYAALPCHHTGRTYWGHARRFDPHQHPATIEPQGRYRRTITPMSADQPKLYCPICDCYAAKFETFGLMPRPNARCPKCRALERHRFMWLFLEQMTNLLDGQPRRMLHIAPQSAIAARLGRIPKLTYLTADLMAPNVSLHMDIAHMPIADNVFNFLYCSHVLEHVPDDRRAMRECYRVLEPGGCAMFLVPIYAKPTIEDPAASDPMQRQQLFGQHDHVRKYRPDIVDRLTAAGFTVRAYTAANINGLDTARYAIRKHEGPVFVCAKPAPGK
jgi:SAM-dependent methyltransferase